MCMAIVMFLLVAPANDLVCSGVTRSNQLSALESASMAAAQDISTIVVNDSHFGYIALTDYPPTGKATLAADGQPLPVTGINTIYATCRQEILLAKLIGNDILYDMAIQDLCEARRASSSLQRVLEESLRPTGKSKVTDKDGNEVKPYEHAKRLFCSNLSKISNSGSANTLTLNLGWLAGPADSATAIPHPETLARIPKGGKFGQNYAAFVDVPIDGESFFFAGMGMTPSLVDAQLFRASDGKRICSIVRATSTCELQTNVQTQLLTGKKTLRTECSACAEPQANQDTSIPGILKITFSNGLLPNLKSLRQLLTDYQMSRTTTDLYTARGGDYPTDRSVLKTDSSNDQAQPLTVLVARGLFDWIRATHGKARLDSVLGIIDLPFDDKSVQGDGNPNFPNLFFEVNQQGNVEVSNLLQNPFLDQTVHENQAYSMCLEGYRSGAVAWTFTLRDQVRNMGSFSGGKHAGEPLVADTINWCELPYFAGNAELATRRLKGAFARGTSVMGTVDGCEGGGNAVSARSAIFSDKDGHILPTQPRQTYYSGGLAVEVKFDSPVAIEALNGK